MAILLVNFVKLLNDSVINFFNCSVFLQSPSVVNKNITRYLQNDTDFNDEYCSDFFSKTVFLVRHVLNMGNYG